MIFQLLISPFHDPYLNLSLENMFLEHTCSEIPKLFLYTNDPSVVIGRFQNPWVETTPSGLGRIHLVRRQSGGGTVFHDRGNLNFSFICSQEAFDKTANLMMICRILERIGLRLSINGRHDLIAGYGGREYKVSGSAFRHKKEAAFHHGTLLVDSDKKLLKKAITPAPGREFVKTGGTASHRSEVINLSELQPQLTIRRILDVFLRYCNEGQDLVQAGPEFPDWERLAASASVQEEEKRLRSEEWLLEKTPAFKQDLRSAFPEESRPLIVEIRKGIIDTAPERLRSLIGLPYGRQRTGGLLKERIGALSNGGRPDDELLRRLLHIIG